MKYTPIYKAFSPPIALFLLQNKLQKLSHHGGECSEANDNLYNSRLGTKKYRVDRVETGCVYQKGKIDKLLFFFSFFPSVEY